MIEEIDGLTTGQQAVKSVSFPSWGDVKDFLNTIPDDSPMLKERVMVDEGNGLEDSPTIASIGIREDRIGMDVY